ncbi:MAG: amidohydrolase [Ruminococcaceae bacterium]|nr:amidohydrolase [Oscillospiraceae bacterium]
MTNTVIKGGFMDAQKILSEAHASLGKMIAHRRYLHTNAETGFSLDKTLKYVENELKKLGYAPQKCGKCGLFADIGEGKSRTLLRADMDALPIKEESEAEFACESGNMHACGHDMHTSMLLGAAKILKAHKNELLRPVRLMFQPAEEILEGAKDMIENGVLDGIDEAFMIHVVSGIDLASGHVIVPAAGVGAPASDHFYVNIRGRGAHGASPQLGVDAIAIGCDILQGFSGLISRSLAMSERATLTVGQFNGGESPNAIANRAVLRGTLRTLDSAVRERLKSQISELSHALAAVHGGEAELVFDHGCPPLLNDEKATRSALAKLSELLGSERVISAEKLGPSSFGGSEDFSYVCEKVPSAVLSLTAGEQKKGYEYPLHHPKVKFDESVLSIGAAVYSALATK